MESSPQLGQDANPYKGNRGRTLPQEGIRRNPYFEIFCISIQFEDFFRKLSFANLFAERIFSSASVRTVNSNYLQCRSNSSLYDAPINFFLSAFASKAPKKSALMLKAIVSCVVGQTFTIGLSIGLAIAFVVVIIIVVVVLVVVLRRRRSRSPTFRTSMSFI